MRHKLLLAEVVNEGTYFAVNEKVVGSGLTSKVADDLVNTLALLQLLPDIGTRRVESRHGVALDVEDDGSILIGYRAKVRILGNHLSTSRNPEFQASVPMPKSVGP